MKTKLFLIAIFIIALIHSGCDEQAINTSVNENNSLKNSNLFRVEVIYWDNQHFEYDATNIEYSPLVDNNEGFAFAIMRDTTFLATHLTENIQGLFIHSK